MGINIKITNLSYRYSASLPQALNNISFLARASACTAILGPTGAGKSTLLQAIAGVLASHHTQGKASGEVALGQEIQRPFPQKTLFPKVGLVLQDPYVQISGLFESVYDEIRFTLGTIGVPKEDHDSRISAIAQELGLTHLMRRNPNLLSGGETQRVALATILVARPQVLLLDEPTTSLDTLAQKQLRRYLHTIKRQTTLLMSDTTLDLSLSLADWIIILDSGRMIFSGSKTELLGRMNDFQALLPTREWNPVVESLSEPKTSTQKRLRPVVGFDEH
jgi:energy-coupling factor transport system ATP-binding protein